MSQTAWELERHIQDRIATLNADRARSARPPGNPSPAAAWLNRRQRDLGFALIRLGQRLTQTDAGRLRLPTPPPDLTRPSA